LVGAIPSEFRTPNYFDLFGEQTTGGIVYIDENFRTLAVGALQEYYELMPEWEALVVGGDSSTSSISDANGANPSVIIGIVSAFLLLVSALFFLPRIRKRARTAK